jgi:hypothetical protein
MKEIDFVMPILNHNILIRTVIESILKNYSPRYIYIITSSYTIDIMKYNIDGYYNNNDNIKFIDENIFFVKNYNYTKNDIKTLYEHKDEKSREFGWWFQHLIKLGACMQIKDLSEKFIIWDSDLIPITPWQMADKFAILREQSNDFNKNEYIKSIYDLIGLKIVEPYDKGTFISYQFIFHKHVIQSLINHIEIYNNSRTENKQNKKNWIEHIMRLSHKYYRFSEYLCVATFMYKYHSNLLKYHSFDLYGKNGIRYYDTTKILNDIITECNIYYGGVSYYEFIHFINHYFKNIPTYIQIEHIKI